MLPLETWGKLGCLEFVEFDNWEHFHSILLSAVIWGGNCSIELRCKWKVRVEKANVDYFKNKQIFSCEEKNRKKYYQRLLKG